METTACALHPLKVDPLSQPVHYQIERHRKKAEHDHRREHQVDFRPPLRRLTPAPAPPSAPRLPPPSPSQKSPAAQYARRGPSGVSANIAETAGSRLVVGPYGSEASHDASPVINPVAIWVDCSGLQIPPACGFDVFEIAVPWTVNCAAESAVPVGHASIP